MKKSVKISVFVAVLLCLVGSLLAVVGLWFAGFSFGNFGAAENKTNTLTVTDTFENVAIETKVANVRFVLSSDGTCRVVCEEREKLFHTATVENNTLIIRSVDERKWYDYVGFYGGENSITVHLPKDIYAKLEVKTDTGDVTLPTVLTFETVNIQTHTGDVLSQMPKADRLTITTDTGDVKVESIKVGTVTVKTNTGDIALHRTDAEGNISVSVDTGDVSFETVACQGLRMESDTGDITLKDTVASGHLAIETDTGDVTLEAADAATIHIETDTGNVKGTLLTPKRFHVEADTGRVRVPDSDTGGRCEITTDTGDIKIYIK